MTDALSPSDHGGRSLVPAEPAKPSRARTIATTMQDIDRQMIGPMNVWSDLETAFPAWFNAFIRVRDVAAGNRLSVNDLLNHRWGPRLCRDLEAAEAALPSAQALEKAHAVVEGVLQTPVDPRRTRVMIGLMVDGFPNARPHNPEAYLETLVHEVVETGTRPHVVAVACRTVTRTAKWLPTPSEFLEVCGKVDKVAWWDDMLGQATRVQARIADVLAERDQILALELQGPPDRDGRAPGRYPEPAFTPASDWKPGMPVPF
jgi:hypothetical protein